MCVYNTEMVTCAECISWRAALQGEALGAQKELAKLRAELALAKSANLASEAVQLDSGARMLVAQLDGADNKSLQVLFMMLLFTSSTACCMRGYIERSLRHI